MKAWKKSFVTILMVLLLVLTSCTSTNNNATNEKQKETTQQSNNNESTTTETNEVASNSLAVESTDIPEGTWQKVVKFPDWQDYTDDTLAMNSMYSFDGFEDQGTLYLKASEPVESFTLFVNNTKVDIPQDNAAGSYQVDISSITKNGENTLQLTHITPRDNEEAIVEVFVPFPTVIEGTPEEVGIRPESLEVINNIIANDVANGFSSAQLAIIKDGKLVYNNAWGLINSYLPDGTVNEDSPEVSTETLYDLASNTKMFSANYAIQYLVSEKLLSLDDKITDILGQGFVDDTIFVDYVDNENPELEVNKEWKSRLTVRDVLRHQAGFPSSMYYHQKEYDPATHKASTEVENPLFSGFDNSKETYDRTLEMIKKTPLKYEPHTDTVYSDIDYMLLTYVIEEVVGKDLDTFVKETFYQPIGLEHITFAPLEHGFNPENCAATELNGNTRDGAVNFNSIRTETLQCEVHDEKSFYAMMGQSGHAGLFASAQDLATLGTVMFSGGYGYNQFFSKNVLDTFVAPKHENNPNWGLGWYREADDRRVWYYGTQSPEDTFGHTGWTGTLTMIDPENHLVIAYLTNKINTPVTDPESAKNQFDGNWFTSSTMGFVPQLLYIGMENDEPVDKTLPYLVAEMTHSKFNLINEEEVTDATHPIVRSGYSLFDSLFQQAEKTNSEEFWKITEDTISLLDETRDNKKIEELRAKLPH